MGLSSMALGTEGKKHRSMQIHWEKIPDQMLNLQFRTKKLI